ncbi:CTP synthase ura7, variant 2 [Trifolium repens]|nr:CTP synthase ura7, variant 2 [Trifolium repens]
MVSGVQPWIRRTRSFAHTLQEKHVRIALVGKYTCLSDSYLLVLKVVEELAKTRLRNSLVFKDTCGSSHREVSGVTSMAKHIRL